MRTLAAAVAVVALVLLSGCTKDPADPAPTPSTAVSPSGTPAASPPPITEGPASSASPSGAPSSDSDPGLIPGADCLNGTWRLVRFIGLGDQSTYGTGQGGDVTVAFDQGRYTLKGQGDQPITVTLAGSTAQLRVDGTVAGTYRPDGGSMVFAIGEASGEGTLQAGNQTQTLPMAQVGQVIAPSGKATMACPRGTLLIALPTVRLEFAR